METETAALVVPEDFPTESWTVGNLVDLDWALARMADIKREQEENERLETVAVQRIQLRTQLLNERLSKAAEFFMAQVTSYAQAHRKELLGNGDKKSRKLLHGVVSWRTVPEKLKVIDPGATLEWATRQPVEAGLIRIREEIEKKALDAHFKKTGELPNGTQLEPAREEFKIETVQGGAKQ